MSENGSSLYTDTTHGGSVPASDVTGTNIALPLVTAYNSQTLHNAHYNDHVLPKLPSHRFRWANWHDLKTPGIVGPQLKNPRVREGPPEREKDLHLMQNEIGESVYHGKKGKDKRDYRDQTESWEQSEFVNLSFQDLQHKYQRDNFLRVLRRLHIVVELNLIENGLSDLSSVSLPKCEFLNANKNHIGSFKRLPKLPSITYLSLAQNNILMLDGLDVLKKTSIEMLYLKGNPVEFLENYRQRVFLTLPQLKILDNIPKLPSDTDPLPPDDNKSTSCIIS